jgi:hypothetical protein
VWTARGSYEDEGSQSTDDEEADRRTRLEPTKRATMMRAVALAPETAWVPERLDERPFWPLTHAFSHLRGHRDWPTVAELDEALATFALRNASGHPLRLERQDPKAPRRRGRRCRDELYDAKIDLHGLLPTRERSWHDLFNALVWATFPRAKAALAHRQHVALQQRLPPVFERLPPTRTPEQDALTLLDEGGGLVVVPEGAEAAAEKAILDGAPFDAMLVIFGHAVYEHLLSTDAPLRVGAHLVVVDPETWRTLRPKGALGHGDREGLAAVDLALAARLEAGEVPRSIGSGLPLTRWQA